MSNNRKKSQQPRGKSQQEIQRQKNKENNRKKQLQIAQVIRSDPRQIIHRANQIDEQNYIDSEEDEWLHNHSSWLSKQDKPSFGMCHDAWGILDFEVWKESQYDY